MTSAEQAAFAEPPSGLIRADFVARFGGIYEHSPWVAERLWDSGLSGVHDRVAGLKVAMAAIVDGADRDVKMALIRTHPDLAGRLAIAGELTAASTSEQASAGLDQCTPEELTRFKELNEAYKARFDFPFIMAVKDRSRQEILAAFEARLGNSPEQEFGTALAEIHKIAGLRLLDLAG